MAKVHNSGRLGMTTDVPVFTRRDLFPAHVIPPLVERGEGFRYVSDARDAAVVVLPTLEIIEDYSAEQLARHGFTNPDDASRLTAEVHRLIDTARDADKLVLAVKHSDDPATTELGNSVQFEQHVQRSQASESTFCMPAWIDESLSAKYLTEANTRRWKSAVPSVGFRGSAALDNWSAERLARDLLTLADDRIPIPDRLRRYRWNEGQQIRAEALDILEASPLVDLDSVRITRGYWQQSETKQEENRLKFVTNLISNDYALCARGMGNFSYRFYESCSMLRVPVFMASDSMLPFDHLIDWRSAVIWVDESERHRVDELVAAHHESLSADALWDGQRAVFDLWQRYCTADGFWRHAGDMVKDRL